MYARKKIRKNLARILTEVIPLKFSATAIFESQLHPQCIQVEGMAYSRVCLICQRGLESKDKYKYLQIDVEPINDCCFDLSDRGNCGFEKPYRISNCRNNMTGIPK